MFLLLHLKLLEKTTLNAHVCQQLLNKCHMPSWWYWEPSPHHFTSSFMSPYIGLINHTACRARQLPADLEPHSSCNSCSLRKKGKQNKKRKRKQRTAPIFMRLFLFLSLPSFRLDTHPDFKARKHPET